MKSFFKITFLGVIILLTLSASAQKEANIWYFGDSAGLDFNTDPPTPLLNSQMYAFEGCASYADSNGNLLFYTDGDTIWNKNHQVMVNGTGILGGLHPIQGRLIIPKPGSNSVYYLFTTGIYSLSNIPFRYSEIDMSLQGGLGAVTSVKNIFLDGPVGESLTAIRHEDSDSIWITVATKCCLTTEIHSFLVTSSGVSTTPVVWSGNTDWLQGLKSMKYSGNGERLALVTTMGPRVLSMNTATGQLTEEFRYLNQGIYYGVEFSPAGRFLYTTTCSNGNMALRQFDLDAGDSTAIANSVYIIDSICYGTLQLAPNGQILCAGPWLDTIAAIRNPNCAGAACNYEAKAFALGGKISRYGLPQFESSMFDTQLVYNIHEQCEFDTTTLKIAGYFIDIDSVVWTFDDSSSNSNSASGLEVNHVFSAYGVYDVSVVIYTDTSICGAGIADTLYDTIKVIIDPVPQISLGNDTILCEGDSLDLFNSNALFPMTYLWSDSTTDEFIQILEPDTYWVQTSTICGVAFDTIVIDSVLPAFVDLGADSILCDGDTVTLDGTVAGGYYLWQDNSTDSVFNAFTTGAYTVASSGICNSDTDTINLFFVHPVEDQLPPDTTFCDGETAIFGIQADSASFVWSNGSIDSSISVQLQDSISVEISNACGTFYDSVIVVIDYPLDPILGPDTVLCLGDTHVYKLNLDANNQYLWHSGDTADSFIVRDNGLVWVHAMNTCGTFADSVLIDYDRVPIIELPEDTLLCDGKVLPLKVHFSRSSYLWNTGSSDSGIVVTSAGEYSVTATNLCGVDSSDIQVDFDFPLSVDLGPSMYGCQGDTIELGFDVPNNPDYSWNSGHRDSSILVTESGRYVLEITNTCGTYSDDVYAYFQAVPYIGFPNDTVVCGELGWIITADDAFDSYLWHDGSKDQSMIIDSSGVFSLQAWSDCGEDRDTVTVNIVDSMAISLGVDTVYCDDLGDIVLDAFAPEALQYEWNTGSSESKLAIDETGFYTVTITDEFGCVAMDEVFVDECPHYFYLPNSFTPNGDGVNDVFRAEGEFISDFVMYVFDRWGNMVNETRDLDKGWNGKYKGEMLPSGMYAVHVKYVSDGKIYERHSQISLMK